MLIFDFKYLKVGTPFWSFVSIIKFYVTLTHVAVVRAYSRQLHLQWNPFRCVNCICTNYSSCHGWWAAYVIGIMYFCFSVYFLRNCPHCCFSLSLTRVFLFAASSWGCIGGWWWFTGPFREGRKWAILVEIG